MELAGKILEGDVQAAAKLMRGIEDEVPSAVEELKSIYPYTGRAYIVGVTGAPGAGKSTLVDVLISTFRQRDMTVGVVAIDPTSPFTGGAILGDRVRMQKHSTDSGVFIRSLATRGWTGGLAKAAISIIHVMDAMSKDIILVETVGIGQAEVDVTRLADTSILVLTPRMGDAIQMMKAGVLEAASIIVVNKADKEDAVSYRRQMKNILDMKESPSEWKPPILLTEAISGKGVHEVVEAIFKHKEFLVSSGKLSGKRRDAARLELSQAVEGLIKTCLNDKTNRDRWEKLVDELVSRRTDPCSAAQIVFSTLFPHKPD